MAKYVSQKNPIPVAYLKRRGIGSVMVYHNGYEDVRFTRIHGGWCRERTDIKWAKSEIVSSASVARECNKAIGCKESWARIY